jgi:hypothetical protein
VPRRLRFLNVLLGGASLLCVAFIVQQLVYPARTAPAARPRPSAAAGGAVAPAAEAQHAPAAAYNVVATRNVFSPTRTEAPVTAAGGGPAVPVVKPNLHGVVLRDTNPIAYLEDPLTKRVAGYRVGDSFAGGTVKTIAADRVTITRPDGSIDVRLRDPSKPRPAAPPAAPGAPAVGPGQPGLPTAMPPRVQAQPQPQVQPLPQVLPAPGGPSQLSPFIPGRRPSPSLGSRLPPSSATSAQPQQ